MATGGGSGVVTSPPACDSAMNRLFIVLAFVSLAGCRMCGSSYDYCVPAHTSRADDYRGCNVFYRAGSIFWQGDSVCNGYGETDIEFVTDRSINAGNFGVTTPVESKRPTPRTLEPRKPDRPPIAIPPKSAAPPPNGDPTKNAHPFEEKTPSLPNFPVLPLPMAPSDFTPVPFDQLQNQDGPPITIEEIRRTDPTVTDFRILSVEDTTSPKVGSQVQ